MAKKTKEALVIASKAKAVLKKSGCNTSGDAFDFFAMVFLRREKAAGL